MTDSICCQTLLCPYKCHAQAHTHTRLLTVTSFFFIHCLPMSKYSTRVNSRFSLNKHYQTARAKQNKERKKVNVTLKQSVFFNQKFVLQYITTYAIGRTQFCLASIPSKINFFYKLFLPLQWHIKCDFRINRKSTKSKNIGT